MATLRLQIGISDDKDQRILDMLDLLTSMPFCLRLIETEDTVIDGFFTVKLTIELDPEGLEGVSAKPK